MSKENFKTIEIILLILIFLTPLVFTSRATTYDIPKIALIESFAFLAFFLWLVNINSTKRFSTIDSPLNIPILSYLAWQIISTFWATNKFEALEIIFLNIALVTIYFIVLNNIRNIQSFVTVMIAAGTLVSVYGILQHRGIDFSTAKMTPLVSSLGNINLAGEYLAMIIPLATVMIFHSKSNYSKIISGIATILMLTHLLLTKSRGAWVGLAGGGIILIFVYFRSRRGSIPEPGRKQFYRTRNLKFLLYLTLILIISFSTIYIVSGRREISSIRKEFVSILNPGERGVFFRFIAWRNTLRMIRHSPVNGVGVGNYKIVYPLYRRPQDRHILGMYVIVERAHNDYLEIASELGLIGLGIFAWLMVRAFKMFKDLLKTQSVLTTGFLASIVSMAISALFGFPLHAPSTSLTFWIILGIAGASRSRTLPVSPSIKAIPRIAFVVAAAVIILAQIHIAQLVLSDFHLQKVRIYQNRGQWDRAIHECKRSIHFYYPNIKAHIYLATALQKRNDMENAFAELETTLRLHPNNPWVHGSLGGIYLRSNEMDRAISFLKKASELHPAYLNELGIVYFKKDMPDEALSTFEKAIDMRWDDEVTYTYLGMIYKKKGDPEKAITMYRKALEITPDYEPARARLEAISGRNPVK